MAKWTTARSRNRIACAALAACLALPASARDSGPEPEFPLPTDDMLLAELPAGSRVETRLDADINGDAVPDTVFVGGNDEARKLVAMIGYKGELDWGHEIPQIGALGPAPLGPAALSVRKNVLVVDDLTGGTTATAYRYRQDTASKKLRLIGIDAQRYSRTNAHGTVKLSWNLLTGAQAVERGEPNTSGKGDEAILYGTPDRTLSHSPPVFLENTPDPDELLDSHVIPADEDRD